MNKEDFTKETVPWPVACDACLRVIPGGGVMWICAETEERARYALCKECAKHADLA